MYLGTNFPIVAIAMVMVTLFQQQGQDFIVKSYFRSSIMNGPPQISPNLVFVRWDVYILDKVKQWAMASAPTLVAPYGLMCLRSAVSWRIVPLFVRWPNTLLVDACTTIFTPHFPSASSKIAVPPWTTIEIVAGILLLFCTYRGLWIEDIVHHNFSSFLQ